jgi:hypothetical protein
VRAEQMNEWMKEAVDADAKLLFCVARDGFLQTKGVAIYAVFVQASLPFQ